MRDSAPSGFPKDDTARVMHKFVAPRYRAISAPEYSNSLLRCFGKTFNKIIVVVFVEEILSSFYSPAYYMMQHTGRI
jgi:hypothetical protein